MSTRAGKEGLEESLMNEFLKRTLSGVVLAVIVISGILYLPVAVIKILVGVLSAVAVYEVSNLLDARLKGFKNNGILLTSLMSSYSLLFLDFYLAVLLIALYSFWIGNRYWNINHTSASFLALVYGAVMLPSIGFLIEIDKRLVFLLFVVVWSGDVFAYLVGKKFGRHKMSPTLSPKKTWEGAVASFVASVIFGVGFLYYVSLPVYYAGAVVVAAVLLQVGDLFESFIKRQVGKKDASNLIPGHGGLIDRIDSLIFAAVVFVIWHKIMVRLFL